MASTMRRVVKTSVGNEVAFDVLPYTTNRAALNRIKVNELAAKHGYTTDSLLNLYVWLFNIMSYVTNWELPDGDDDFEVNALRDYLGKANGNVEHNYDLLLDVPEGIAADISRETWSAREDYQAR
ncbi:MAG: hypothetical protein ACYS7Y_35350, partial [Planctomycetota bacterium]